MLAEALRCARSKAQLKAVPGVVWTGMDWRKAALRPAASNGPGPGILCTSDVSPRRQPLFWPTCWHRTAWPGAPSLAGSSSAACWRTARPWSGLRHGPFHTRLAADVPGSASAGHHLGNPQDTAKTARKTVKEMGVFFPDFFPGVRAGASQFNNCDFITQTLTRFAPSAKLLDVPPFPGLPAASWGRSAALPP